MHVSLCCQPMEMRVWVDVASLPNPLKRLDAAIQWLISRVIVDGNRLRSSNRCSYHVTVAWPRRHGYSCGGAMPTAPFAALIAATDALTARSPARPIVYHHHDAAATPPYVVPTSDQAIRALHACSGQWWYGSTAGVAEDTTR